ncbi:hypothetical protein [Segeticoccus rhizosphaerae]|uniref:hypothetical protein n=1 Tax=Segeticoccus rhizosphaerae TaxID=1104777 RepID=UPI0010BFABD6|nr:hypothetical protein [Ornithinicoccus soli]
MSYLTGPETDAVLTAPDRATWYGRRDHALLVTAVPTGLLLSELTGLTIQDVTTTIPGSDAPPAKAKECLMCLVLNQLPRVGPGSYSYYRDGYAPEASLPRVPPEGKRARQVAEV